MVTILLYQLNKKCGKTVQRVNSLFLTIFFHFHAGPNILTHKQQIDKVKKQDLSKTLNIYLKTITWAIVCNSISASFILFHIFILSLQNIK